MVSLSVNPSRSWVYAENGIKTRCRRCCGGVRKSDHARPRKAWCSASLATAARNSSMAAMLGNSKVVAKAGPSTDAIC
jgi:hypothetical protein